MTGIFKFFSWQKKQKAEIKRLRDALFEKAKQVELLGSTLKQKESRIKELEEQLDSPSLLGLQWASAGVRILSISNKRGADLEKIGAYTTLGLLAVELLQSKLWDRPFKIPTVPQKDLTTYRIFDSHLQRERVLSEAQFGELLKERLIVRQ